MTAEIMRIIHNTTTSDITSEQVLRWAKRIEAQRAQKAILTIIQENRNHDMIRLVKPPNENKSMSNSQSLMKGRCQYST